MRVPYAGAPRVPRYRLTLTGYMLLVALGLWAVVAWLLLRYA